jgi:G3E family GTPase
LNVLPTEQIILETTGLANPSAVAEALDSLDDLIKPGLCISLVDACDIEKLLADGYTMFPRLLEEQISQANVLICNKSDRASPEGLIQIMDTLKNMNPRATLFNTSYGRIPFGELDRLSEQVGIREPASTTFHPAPAKHITHRDESYGSFSVKVTQPMDAKNLANIIRLARDKVPRIKGIIDSVEEHGPMVVQYAAGTLSLETPLSSPGPDRFRVLIGKRLDASFKSLLLRQPGLQE